MAYRLENGEAVADGVRRAGREQLDAAVRELTAGVNAIRLSQFTRPIPRDQQLSPEPPEKS